MTKVSNSEIEVKTLITLWKQAKKIQSNESAWQIYLYRTRVMIIMEVRHVSESKYLYKMWPFPSTIFTILNHTPRKTPNQRTPGLLSLYARLLRSFPLRHVTFRCRRYN